jgi:D-alanyl-D-alanine carboxypeptidase
MVRWLQTGRCGWSFVLTVVLFGLMASRPASAQVGSDRYGSIVIDAKTGNVLSAINADEPRFPASLTKMMTIYMLFEALRDRRVTLDEAVPVSAHAASMEPSKLGLVPGTYITVEQALLGLVTKSANDAASALGELMGGDEDQFAQMMTLRARALGMSRTTFRNASGLPNPEQTTTARDLATLARHLVQDYPAEYHYFSTPSFMFHRRVIMNHDRMLQTYPGADGLKTGYTDASGCNLVTSAVHGDVRLIGVVLGASNGGERDANMASLLDAGFEQMGVPVSRSTPEPRRSRFPALIASASAAPLPARLRYHGEQRFAARSYAPPSRMVAGHEYVPPVRAIVARGYAPRLRTAAAHGDALTRSAVAESRRHPVARPRLRSAAVPGKVIHGSGGRSSAANSQYNSRSRG